MNITISILDIHWLSVIIATLLAFGIGGLWYSPVLFGNIWLKEIKHIDEDPNKSNMALIFGFAFLLNFVSAIVLDLVIGLESSLFDGILKSLMVCGAFVVTALGINYLFSSKSLNLFLIDAGYFLFYYAVMGAVLGAW